MQFSCVTPSSASVTPHAWSAVHFLKVTWEKKKKVLSPTYKNPLKDCGSSLFSCFFSQCDTQMLDSRKTPPRICVNPQQSFTSFRTTAKWKMKLSGQSWITTANMCIDAEKLYHLKEEVEANESLNKQHLLQIYSTNFLRLHMKANVKGNNARSL